MHVRFTRCVSTCILNGDTLTPRSESLLWRLAHWDRQVGERLGRRRHLSWQPKQFTLTKGSLLSEANLAWSPLLSSPIPHRMGKPALATKQQWGTGSGVWKGENICSPDGIHVRPTGLGNSFHKFLSKLNSTVQTEALRGKQRRLHQHPRPQGSSTPAMREHVRCAAPLLREAALPPPGSPARPPPLPSLCRPVLSGFPLPLRPGRRS